MKYLNDKNEDLMDGVGFSEDFGQIRKRSKINLDSGGLFNGVDISTELLKIRGGPFVNDVSLAEHIS